MVVFDLTAIVMYFVYSDNWIVKKKWKKIYKIFFLKDGSKVNYHFLSIRMQRKKNLVRAVHKRREPQRHLLEKNGTWKLYDEVLRISQEFPEK